MAQVDEIARLRLKLVEAVKAGVVGADSAPAVQQIILQLASEAERARQSCEQSVAQLQEKISHMRGKADGFSQVASIAYAVLDGLVTQAERASEEEQRLRAEKAAEVEKPATMVSQHVGGGRKRREPKG